MTDSKRIDQDRVEVDWRSGASEFSEDPRKGAWISQPKKLAGRRLFPQVPLGNLQAALPNLKALMLDQSKKSWEAAQVVRRELKTRSRHQDPRDHESASFLLFLLAPMLKGSLPSEAGNLYFS